MVIGEGAEVEGQGHRLGLAGLQLHAGKALELFGRAHQLRLAIVDVELHNLPAGHRARVRHIHGDGQPLHIAEGLRRDAHPAVGEGGVAAPITEGELHRLFAHVIVAIADEKPLAVPHFAVLAGVVDVGGRVGKLQGEGLRQLARRVDDPKEDVRNRAAAGLSHHPGLEHGRRRVNPRAHGDRRAVVQDDDAVGLHRAHGLDQGHLLPGQVEICPVISFRLLVGRQRDVKQRHLRRLRRGDGRLDQVRLTAVVGGIALAEGDFGAASEFRQFLQRHVHLCGIDVRAAATLEVRFPGRSPDHRHATHVLQRQQAVVLEQHHPLAGNAAHERVMRCRIERRPLRRLRCFEDDAQNPPHRFIQHGLIQRAALHRLHHRLYPPRARAGHFEIEAAFQSRDTIVHRAPIGDDEAFQAPFLLEDFGEQMRLFRAIDAIDAVVGAHHRPGLRFLDRDLERGKVDLAEGALIHLSVDGHALIFLIVGRVVLERRPHSPALDAVDEAGRHFARQVGILREILEVAPAQRRALHVHAGAENDVHMQGDALLGQRLAHFLNQGGIPGCRQAGGSGETGRRQAFLDQGGLIGHPTHAVRPIGDGHARHAEAFDGSSAPGSSAGAQRRFLFQGHLGDNGCDVSHHDAPFNEMFGYRIEWDLSISGCTMAGLLRDDRTPGSGPYA